mgnify:CR=1 FL=1
MKKINYLFSIILLMAGYSTNVSAQVSNDNEDGVYKETRPQAKEYVPGQVLFKLKDGQQAQVRRAAGRVQSAGINTLDKVLQEFGAEEMEQLLPKAKVTGAARRSKAYNGETVEERDLTQLYKVTLPEEKAEQTLQLVEQLKSLDEVEFAEPNYRLYLLDSNIAANYAGNSYASQQWYLDTYGVKELWGKPIINSTRPVIAIIDTGVDLTHPDLKDNLWTNQAEADGEADYDNDGNGFKGDVHGWDFINNTGNIRDNNMHGTHVAGIAAASNNNIGIVGANPMARIMAVSVMQSDGTGDVATIIKGIDYAVQNGATVLNLSLGSYANSSALRQSLERAYQRAVIVAAAGNDGRCINTSHYPDPCKLVGPMFPAAYSFVLGVQATTPTGTLAAFSNYDDNGNTFSDASTLQDPDGFNYELQAPGVNMLSTIPGGKYKALNGTSMASPLVAGAVSALMMVKQYDTQEVLWGDLLHSSNIAQAFNVTNRPAELDLLKIQMRNRKDLADETEADYGNDHEVDAGELVSIYPVIRTTFGEASNIKLKLEMGDEFEDPTTVDIQTGTADFGMHLDAYGRGVSWNPLVLKVANNVADARHIRLKIVATCDESAKTYEWPFTIVVTNMVKINGLISEDMTLTADHTYLVNENLGVMEGATLTIEPGTRIEVMEGMGISSFGKLVANGTPERPITFTRHAGEGPWKGIQSHESTGKHNHEAALYTDDAKTRFTLLPTAATPNKFTYQYKYVYYGANEDNPGKNFYLRDYIDDFSSDMTSRQHLLTDPNYLTPAVLEMLSDWEAYWSQYPTQRSDDKPNSSFVRAYLFEWQTYDNPRDTISYCRMDGFNWGTPYHPYMKDCVLDYSSFNNWSAFYQVAGIRNTLMNMNANISANNLNSNSDSRLRQSNIVNNYFGYYRAPYLAPFSQILESNYLNNFAGCNESGKYYGLEYSLGVNSTTPTIDQSTAPSYLGTGREDLIRPYVYEIGNAPNTYGQIDLSNMLTKPVAEAHGIVWKVVVNGKDAQDEYDQLPPLGVGKHKFEVYFNRPMNKAVAPQISFGVRDPYTQQAVAEDGSWNADGTIYTAYKTIDGKTKSDGVCRIYVHGAEDNEYFEVPYEKTRFNIQVQAAGSMATGFAAEAGMGKVNLTWNNENNNFDDAMGFNIYRYGEPYEKTLPAGWYDGHHYSEDRTIMVTDTVRLNTEILDIETIAYTDYDVTPGSTYYYYYKVLSTGLQEYDVSNVVTATPLTATQGDANGSGAVDVADVITTVNYAAGMDPKPFIFEAADMNTDLNIDILDVIGIIQKIMNPGAAPVLAAAEPAAEYTIEDGVLYVESPVTLAGVQVQLNMDEQHEVTVADDLSGFEHVTAWLTDNDMLFLAYNMNGKTLTAGKHALLRIGDSSISSMKLSDALGRNVTAVAGNTTAIDAMGSKVLLQGGVFNLKGQKVAGKATDLQKLPKGVYIINGEKVVK